MDKDITNVEFFTKLDELTNVIRYKDLPAMHCSVNSHIYNCIMIATTLIDEYNLDLNREHVIDMLLYHDVPELGMKFDFTAPTLEKSVILQQIKADRENTLVENVSKNYNKPKFKELFEEFEKDNTREANFANLVDKLESMIHVLSRKCEGFVENDYKFSIKRADKYMPLFPELTNFINNIKSQINSYYVVYLNNVTEQEKDS